MKQKILIFDSGSLINFSMNGLTNLLPGLKKVFKGKFIIPEDVKYEIIDHPKNIKRFELGALSLQKLLYDKILQLPSSISFSNQEIKEKSRDILHKSNNSFISKGKFLHIIDKGEAACLALHKLAEEKGFQSTIVIDERTTRMISEAPENMRKIFENRFHSRVKLKSDFSYLKNIPFIRSSELVFVAYKKGLVKIKDKKILEALLYATKFKGCAISEEEIEKAKNL